MSTTYFLMVFTQLQLVLEAADSQARGREARAPAKQEAQGATARHERSGGGEAEKEEEG